jgi:hypothetical protein
LYQCNADGSVSRVLLAGGVNSILDFQIQSDGKVIAWSSGGITIGGVVRKSIARINTDGTLDTTFDPGFGPNAQISNVTFQQDGKILVCGYFTSFDNIPANGLVRLTSG